MIQEVIDKRKGQDGVLVLFIQEQKLYCGDSAQVVGKWIGTMEANFPEATS